MPPLPRSTRRALFGGLTALGPLLSAGPAAAHALVLSSQPSSGAQLGAAPDRVVLRFNSRIDHERSRMTLFGPDNATLSLTLAPETDPAVIEALLPPTLAPGPWRLRWQVLAVDGHITRGDIFFTIGGR